MKSSASDNSLGTGVYYSEEDYVGLGKRLVIIVVDLCVILFAWWIISILWETLPPHDFTDTVLQWSYLVVPYTYMTVIKASTIRTLGYRLMGAKVLTLKGERPSVLRMTLRFFLWVAGPFNFVADLIWVGIDQDRQSLRDRFAGTCVVRADATPVGEAPIHLAYYQAIGMSLMLPTVARPMSE